MSVNKSISSIREAIDVMARFEPETPFLISPETETQVSFQALQQQSNLLSGMLHQTGLEKGDKVAFLMDNGLLTAELFLGTMYGGFVAVPLNVRAGAMQLSYMLDHCDAELIFVEEQYTVLLREALGNVRRDMRVIVVGVDGPMPAFETVTHGYAPAPLSSDDPALLIYSSGSTGKPKGAIHTHSSVLAHGWNSIQAHEMTSSDRSLLMLPLYHINAECVTLIPTLLSGGSVVVAHRFVVSKFWDWIDDLKITWSALVPTIISELVDWNDPGKDHRQEAFARIRFFRSSSAPLSPTLHQQFIDKFHLPLLQAMGSTEGGNVFSNPVPPGKNKIGSPGLPWGFETRIVDREGTDVPRGESGEMLLRGRALMKGYYKDPEGTAAVVDSEGWLHTGDLARQDEDGYFFVVGRSKELIIKGGVNIAPRQIDEVLESHPAVLEAAAVGVPDRYLGEDVVAFVVLRAGFDGSERELLAFCEDRLGLFKTPTRIQFIAELPKGPSGKVQRLRLSEQAAQLAVSNSASALNQFIAERADEAPASDKPAPATSIEQIVMETWKEVLRVAEVDGESNFFALGGHSLLAMQCVSRFRETLPVALSLSDFFEYDTVTKLVALVKFRLRAIGRTEGKPLDETSSLTIADDLRPNISLPQIAAIPLRDSTIPCRLSYAQQGLWFLEQLNPGSPLYNESEAIRLHGEFKIEAMERALNLIVARHETLRTTIELTDNEPAMVVHDRWPIRIKRLDLSERTLADREADLARLLIEEPSQIFHLESEPGIRATVVRLTADEHVFILMMHHVLSDRSSFGIIWKEIAALYRAFRRGEPFALASSPIEYTDYISWQREQTTEASSANDLAFWTEKLRGAPQSLELPTDGPRPMIPTYRGIKQRFRFNPALTNALRALSKQEKTSLFNLFTAALNALFYRYSGQEDILLGIPVADRERPELGSVTGLLVDTQVLRTTVSGDTTFRELLGRVQKGIVELYRHRAVPFEQVVQKVRRERGQGYSSLFQVMINWRDRDLQAAFIGLDGLRVEPLLSQTKTSKNEMTWFVTDGEDEIELEIEYNTDLFDEQRMSRMVGHFETLLGAAASDAEQRIDRMPLLMEAERHTLLVEWNNTTADYPREVSLARLVEEQVERTPNAVAVVSENKQLTFRELNARANRLANELLKHGARPDEAIGVYVGRSTDLVVALLAIIKSGAAYLPLDPLFPAERLSYMLEDSGARLLVSERKLYGELPDFAGEAILLEDEDWQANSSENPVIAVAPENLSYLIYTSGSTGKPKGVQVPRGALTNFLWSMRQWLQMSERDRLLAVTTISFDIAGLEIWLPLLVGAQMIVASREAALDGNALRDLIVNHNITFLQATPVTWQLLFGAGWLGKPDMQAVCGGEAMPSEVATQLVPAVGRVWNLYGPTETTIWSTGYRLTDGRQPVLIGRPLANTQVYILDKQNQPVPVGVPGELYIGGDGVACGYLHRPVLMAQKFVPDSFRNDGSRMYRTGDLARYRADGNIECLGRIDHQVKLRGYRIELGEIEARLKEQPGIKQAVVVAREDTPGDKRLVAYLVADFGSTQCADSDISVENTEQWKKLWGNTYSNAEISQDQTPGLAGWNSSYTREGIGGEAMREQMEFAAERLLAFRPRKALEIGCGTGLILFRIAPHCEKFVGMDFSSTAIETLGQQVKHHGFQNVELYERAANQLEDFAPGSFDLVIMNSIAQYFPNIDYLVNVLDKLMTVVGPGGTIQLGDLRNLALLEAYHVSVQDFISLDTMPVEEFARQVRNQIAIEKELLVDPSFFQALKKRYPRLGHVTLQLKRGRIQTELSRFRYDAFLHLDTELDQQGEIEQRDWSSSGQALSALTDMLSNGNTKNLRVTHIPNDRVIDYVSAWKALDSMAGKTVGTLRKEARGTSLRIEPEDLWSLGVKLGFETEISWCAEPGWEDCFDVLFRRVAPTFHALPASALTEPIHDVPLAGYGNNPLQNKLNTTLISQIRTALKVHLPEYMVPAAFVSLNTFPLTPNGKLDRKALPAPEADTIVTPGKETPQGETEMIVANIWTEVLKLDRVGRNDNFFDLGGHSLLLAQVQASVSKELNARVSIVEMFQYPTVSSFARHISRPSTGSARLQKAQERMRRRKEELGLRREVKGR